MRKSKKKLLAMALASAMATSLLPMTAFADDETVTNSGRISTDVTIISPLIRVNVPTSLEVSIDQFELGGSGSQIYSENFTMENVSETAVNIEVTSTATGTGSTFVGTRTGATDEGQMWLGAVAAQAKDKYQENDNLSLLNEESVNVSTFSTADSKTTAKQDFYLGNDADISYELFIPTASEAVEATETTQAEPAKLTNGKTYVEYHKLTKVDLGNGADENAKLAILNNKLVKGDLYLQETTVGGKTPLTKIKKGKVLTTSDTALFKAAGTYYTASGTKTSEAGLITAAAENSADSKSFVAIDTSQPATNATAAKNKAEFRYIGTLSEATRVWNTTLLNKVDIAYDITPVSPDKYEEVEPACKYGYYQTLPPTIEAKASTGVTIDGTSGVITLKKGSDLNIAYTLGTRSLAATDVSSVTFMKDTAATVLTKGNDYTVENGVIKLIAEGSKLKSIIGSGVKTAVDASANYYVKVVFNNSANTFANTNVILVNLQ